MPLPYVRTLVGAILSVIALSVVIAGTSYFVAPVTEDLGVSRAAFMGHYSIFTALSIITMPIAGRVAQRIGTKRLMALGGVWTALCVAAMALATELWMFYLLAVGVGLTLFSTTTLLAMSLANVWFDKFRGIAVGLIGGLGALGGVFASAILPSFVAENGWRAGYVLLAIAFAAFSVGGALLVAKSTPAEAGLRPYGAAEVDELDRSTAAVVKGVSARTALRSFPFWAIFVGIAVYMMVVAGSEHYPAHLLDSGMEPTTLGAVMSFYYAGMILATLLVGVIVDRFGIYVAFAVVWILSALGWLALLLAGASDVIMTMGLYAVLFASGAGMLPSLITRKAFGERDYSTLLGIMYPAGTVGMAIAAPLWGLSHDLTGSYSPAFLIAILVFAAGLGIAAVGLVAAARRWGADPVEVEAVPAPLADMIR